MDFPIAGVTVNPLLLAGIGFLVGILGGFFGVGGGFIATPFMVWAGVPWNIAIGTDLAHMTGKSIVAAKRHRSLGHVDMKLGLVLVVVTVVGVEAGAQIIEKLEVAGKVDVVIGIFYVLILLIISGFTAWESLRALRMVRTDQISVDDALGFEGLAHKVYGIKLPPMLSFPDSGIASVSLWTVLFVGFITGILSGALGVGGGFIRMPLLVYVIGVPTHVAVGTDLFSVIFSSGYGTLTHAMKGNVDILMALVMQTGAALGAQIGATSTRFFAGPRIRLLFSVLPLIGAVMVILEMFGLAAH
jgi:uncharacterized membrane protein YfcA